jgi:TnpA family transposase
MISDQAVGLAGKVVSDAPRDSLRAVDVAFSLDHGQRPDILISDRGAYSDLMFGPCNPLGIEYGLGLADMPDQRAWRADRHADSGPLDTPARGRLDLPKIGRHWPDILRVIASIYT